MVKNRGKIRKNLLTEHLQATIIIKRVCGCFFMPKKQEGSAEHDTLHNFILLQNIYLKKEVKQNANI